MWGVGGGTDKRTEINWVVSYVCRHNLLESCCSDNMCIVC